MEAPRRYWAWGLGEDRFMQVADLVSLGTEVAYLNEGYFYPHFQPIINVTTRQVTGYEVLGRLYSPQIGGYQSLGGFFHNPAEDVVAMYSVDRIIREKAVRMLKESNLRTKLFFNIMPNFLSRVHKSDLQVERFHIVQLIEKYGINKRDVVIEITEDEFEGSIDKLIQMVAVFREYGLTIAIDDLGVGFSNLERIGYLHPDIIKVDINIMRESLNRNAFHHVLTAVSEMSQKLGSHLLFEGIETEEELQLALSMGANLLQGYYFAKPSGQFINKNTFSKDLKNTLEKFAGLRFLELSQELNKEEDLAMCMESIFGSLGDISIDSEFLPKVLPLLPSHMTKVFLCDLHGYQTTATYTRDESKRWVEQRSGRGNNYAWKPYFVKHKALSCKGQKKWSITPALFDIRKQSEYVVFTYSLSSHTILVARVEWIS